MLLQKLLCGILWVKSYEGSIPEPACISERVPVSTAPSAAILQPCHLCCQAAFQVCYDSSGQEGKSKCEHLSHPPKSLRSCLM